MSEGVAGSGNADPNGCQVFKVKNDESLPCIAVIIVQPDDEVVCGTPTAAKA